jgi:lysophospholipase L1-like esterase
MLTRGRLFVVATGSAIAALVAAEYAVSTISRSVEGETVSEPRSAPMPLAVLGNSDSHAFHDSLSFPPGSGLRGGAEHARTFQWTEVLAQLRGTVLDQGEWGVHGWHPRMARVAGWFGGELRTPRKQDFAFNFAVSGATCAHLGGARGQVAPLVRLLRERSAAWDDGAIIIRIGINDVGVRAVLDRVATRGVDSASRALVDACAREIADAIRRIREAHPTVHVLVVGIADNTNWPPNFDAWRSAAEMQRLAAFHDAFDDTLRRTVGGVPHASFFDDRAWFRDHWGARGPTGELAYRDVCVGGLAVRHAQSDRLSSSILKDGHAGTVLNALWARSVLQSIIDATGTTVAPIERGEIDAFIGRLRDGAPGAPVTGDCAEAD